VANSYYRCFRVYVCLSLKRKSLFHTSVSRQDGGVSRSRERGAHQSITKTANSKRNGNGASTIILQYYVEQPIAAMSVSRLRTALALHTYLSSEIGFGRAQRAPSHGRAKAAVSESERESGSGWGIGSPPKKTEAHVDAIGELEPQCVGMFKYSVLGSVVS